MTTYTQAIALKEVREALKVITNDLGCSIEAAGENHAADKRIVMARVALEKLDAMISQKEAAPSASQPPIKFRHGCVWCGKAQCSESCPSLMAAPSTSQVDMDVLIDELTHTAACYHDYNSLRQRIADVVSAHITAEYIAALKEKKV